MIGRDPRRIDRIIVKFELLWRRSPDMRFGQMMSLVASKIKTDPFYVEDHEWEAALDRLISREE
jgi:hypothetical protein